MTELERIQKEIDKCNDKRGCDYWCEKSEQTNCEKLQAHADRMEYCRKCNLPIQYW